MASAVAYARRVRSPTLLDRLLTTEAGQEWALSCAMLLPLLFINQLWTGGAALFIFFALTYFYLRRQELVGAFMNRWPLMLAPAFFLASLLWSDYPSVTLKQALMVGVTMAAGFALSASRRPDAVLLGLFTAFSIFLMASVAFGHWIMTGGFGGGYGGEVAFGGLNGRKNLMGATAGMAVLVSLGAVVVFARARAHLGVLAAIAMLGVATFALIAARSAGAIVSAALAASVFLALLGLGRMPRNGRLFACGLVGMLLLLVAAFARLLSDSATATVMQAFNKDPSFTGRTYIWYRAQDFISEHPLLGRGFGAFWIQGNPDAEGLWRFGKITERIGFSFHNTMVELLVHIGWVGAVLLIGLFAVSVFLLLRKFVRRPEAVACFHLAFVVNALALSPFESVGAPAPFDVASFLFMIAMGYGYRGFWTRRITFVATVPLGSSIEAGGPRRDARRPPASVVDVGSRRFPLAHRPNVRG